jgi:hypothetical protein
MTNLEEFTKDVTLRASLWRIKRRADIMAMDLNTASKSDVKMGIEEVQKLVGIALRCLGEENEGK